MQLRLVPIKQKQNLIKKTMNKKEQLINREATALRIKHQFNELTELECKAFVENVVTKALTLGVVVNQRELLLKQQSDWLMKSTTLSVEAIVEFEQYFKQ